MVYLKFTFLINDPSIEVDYGTERRQLFKHHKLSEYF